MKQGQISLFVIIAILLVATTALVVYLQREAIGLKLNPKTPETSQINSFITSCIQSTAENALVFTGKQGGYYILPKNSIDNYVYYFAANKSYFPRKSIIENHISLYLNEMLPACTQDFIDFKDFQISADPKALKTKTTILKDKVRFEIQWPITIKKAETTYLLKSFSVDVESRLYTIYAVAQTSITEQLKNLDLICFSCLDNLATENEVYLDMSYYNDEIIIFSIIDKKILIKNQPYEFTFANKY